MEQRRIGVRFRYYSVTIMIELFVFLLVLQGDSPEEWLESCRTDFPAWDPERDWENPDAIFCGIVDELDLSVTDVERLGRDMNWSNYVMLTTDGFIDGWKFYQEHADKETLTILPVVSLRESLPPSMRATISFNYTENGQDKYFEKGFKVNPLLLHPVCNDEVEGYPCIDKDSVCLEQHWNTDSHGCEIWRNSVYAGIVLVVVVTVAAILLYYYRRVLWQDRPR